MKAIYLDDRLHARLKIRAAREGRPLKDIVESLLTSALANDSVGPEVSTREIQLLAARGGSFDFLLDEREDIYSLDEGEPIE